MDDRLIELLYESNVRCDIGIESLAEDIRSIFADVQPVKRGKWKWDEKPIFGNPYGSYICSECGAQADYKENYCCECGADMREPTE